MTRNWTSGDVADLVRKGKVAVHGEKRLPVTVPAPAAMAPTQAELEAERLLTERFGWEPAIHQGRVFKLASSHLYTCDLWYPGRNTAVEVKGFRHGSYQRSRLAFDVARLEFPGVWWVWIEKRKPSRGRPPHWRIEVY